MKIKPYEPQNFAEAYAVISAANAVDHTRRVKADVLQSDLDEGVIEATVALNDAEAIVGIVTWELLDSGYFAQGWVHPDWRDQGVGSGLLRAAEENLCKRLRKRTGCIARVYQDIPNVEALFRSQGYEETRRFYNMSVSLEGCQFEVALPPGVTLKPFEQSDSEALVEADNEFFADHWGAQPRSLRDWKYQLIESRPHDPALWVVAWANGEIVGECLCHASLQGGAKDGWIAIVGVKRQWRRLGLGHAMLSHGLQGLQRAGYETASLHVDAENVAAVRLYRSMGMEIARTRLHFRKVLVPVSW